MTSIYEIATIPAIAAIVYTIIDIAKTAVGGTEQFKRFIPLISCALGAIIGPTTQSAWTSQAPSAIPHQSRCQAPAHRRMPIRRFLVYWFPPLLSVFDGSVQPHCKCPKRTHEV